MPQGKQSWGIRDRAVGEILGSDRNSRESSDREAPSDVRVAGGGIGCADRRWGKFVLPQVFRGRRDESGAGQRRARQFRIIMRAVQASSRRVHVKKRKDNSPTFLVSHPRLRGSGRGRR